MEMQNSFYTMSTDVFQKKKLRPVLWIFRYLHKPTPLYSPYILSAIKQQKVHLSSTIISSVSLP